MSKVSCSPNGSDQKSKGSSEGDLKWWQLSLIGVGCTIGTGYFLGSSIGIGITGSSIIFSFILAAIGTYVVFNILAKMTAADPQKVHSVIMHGKPTGNGLDLAVDGIIGAQIFLLWAAN